MRRLREHDRVRSFVAESRVCVEDLLWPIFVLEGTGKREEIEGMPGVYRMSIDEVLKRVVEVYDKGLCGVMIFPVVERSLRTEDGGEALKEENLACRCVRAIRDLCPFLMIICDVALDPYTSHGHDGLLCDGEIDNDGTVKVLEKMACVLAASGCDTVAPSDMMDGRVGSIRAALDSSGFEKTRILSYGAKYASCLYGPFREALSSGGLLRGDKKSYQMDPANVREAMRELSLDVSEGADMLMVKPGMWYMDVLSLASRSFDIPVLSYQVSGEYEMIWKAGGDDAGRWRLVEESFLCLKRAGARGIVSYFAYDWVCRFRGGVEDGGRGEG
jgi:porphobilinogen synthase